METYTILVCVLALIFCFVLSFVIILAVKLRKHYFHQSKKRSEYGPFTPEERRSLTKQHRKKLDSLSIVDEEPDNVFEDEDLTDTSQITFSLLHIPTDDVLLLDVWSVTDTPSDFIKGFVEAQLFPTDFDAGQFCTNVREVFHNEIKNNEGFSFPNVSSEVLANNTVIYNESFAFPNISSQVLANVYLKLFLYTTYEVSQPKCVGHTVFALNEVPWNPLGKTQFKQELRHHQANESPPAITDEKSPCASPSRAEKGELYISLRYQRNSGRINVVVLKAENIQKGSVLQSDPYVKIKLLYQGEVIEKKQTKSQRRNSSPCWNEPFAFNIDEERGLNNYELIFLVRRRDLLSPNSTLGIVRVGAQVRGAGQSHWYAMMAKGNLMRQVARRHRIK